MRNLEHIGKEPDIMGDNIFLPHIAADGGGSVVVPDYLFSCNFYGERREVKELRTLRVVGKIGVGLGQSLQRGGGEGRRCEYEVTQLTRSCRVDSPAVNELADFLRGYEFYDIALDTDKLSSGGVFILQGIESVQH